MKVQKIIVALFCVTFFNCVDAGNLKTTFDRLHKKLDSLPEKAATDVKALFQKGSRLVTSSSHTLPTLDIEVVNGVKLIKGLKRDAQVDKKVSQLFWCKQVGLVALFESDFAQGLAQLTELITQRSMDRKSLLINFMEEIVQEDHVLNECLQHANHQEAAQISALQITLDGLLGSLTKALGIQN